MYQNLIGYYSDYDEEEEEDIKKDDDSGVGDDNDQKIKMFIMRNSSFLYQKQY